MTPLLFESGQTGVFFDLPSAAYFKETALSHSLMKELHPTPAHGLSYLSAVREPSIAMIIGTLVHHMILQPEVPPLEVAVIPDTYPAMKGNALVKSGEIREGDPIPWNGNSSYCKAWRKGQESEGRFVLQRTGKDGYESVMAMVKSAASNPSVRELIMEGDSEVSLFAEINTVHGPIRGKARLDFVPKIPWLIDFKTTQDASPDSFAKDLVNLRYASQAAWYLETWNRLCDMENRKQGFIFFAIEKNPPYLVACYKLDKEALQWGSERCQEDVDTYARCFHTGEWPGYSNKIIPLSLPSFIKRSTH